MRMRKQVAAGLLCLALTYGAAQLYNNYTGHMELPRVKRADIYPKNLTAIPSEHAYWLEIHAELPRKLGGV